MIVSYLLRVHTFSGFILQIGRLSPDFLAGRCVLFNDLILNWAGFSLIKTWRFSLQATWISLANVLSLSPPLRLLRCDASCLQSMLLCLIVEALALLLGTRGILVGIMAMGYNCKHLFYLPSCRLRPGVPLLDKLRRSFSFIGERDESLDFLRISETLSDSFVQLLRMCMSYCTWSFWSIFHFSLAYVRYRWNSHSSELLERCLIRDT